MVRYTAYARKRLPRRKIPLELVERVLSNPEQTIESRRRKIAQGRFTAQSGKEHLLRVVFEEAGEDLIVVTVYETSRVRRYWRTE